MIVFRNLISSSAPTSFIYTKQITETMATHVIEEFRDRETCKLNVIIHNAPESTATEPSVHIAHDAKFDAYIAKVIKAKTWNVIECQEAT